jgi:hypothetical protein
MRYLACFVVFFLYAFIMGQDGDYVVRVQHYQRKLTLNYLPLPNAEMIPKDFSIQIPDTVYNHSQIEVKKFSVIHDDERLFKNAYIVLASREKKIYQVNIAIHRKFVQKFEQFLMDGHQFMADNQNDIFVIGENERKIEVKKEVLNRQVNYSFNLQKD